ncbi:T9SS type A sorting domain-containing protein [Pedobacter sp. BS3]|uniref:T9SS type A sorting domain-containing protein n=1 Tax=Pedobacter sp. BS3 TaxID=2567937 RepID=UPI0011EF7788|nr:T9SS type A sorting domain-containing protein [Pedobacter sp. BS3]TZF83215.1 T9SS type A sorting domain-containing protein [Pedobacter sp. BS3]
MKKLYSKLFGPVSVALAAITVLCNISLYAAVAPTLSDSSQIKQQSSAKSTSKISDTRPNRPLLTRITSSIFGFIPFNPNTLKSSSLIINSTPQNLLQPDDKTVSNVKVYPNPVSDLLNLSYHVNRNANVTIKVMDVLGNEITTLLSQRVSAGEQSNTFYVANKLNSGVYFIRLMVGNESIVKRISVQ